MTPQSFDHERLEAAQPLEGLHCHARGSALECAAIQDVLVRTNGLKLSDDVAMKAMLYRIVAMLTRMAMKFD